MRALNCGNRRGGTPRLGLALALVALLGLGLGGCRPAPQPEAANAPLTVLVPCGMTAALQAVAEQFTELPVVLDAKCASSARLTRDALRKNEVNGVLISPGNRQMEILRKAGLVQANTITPVCRFELVAIVPPGNPARVSNPQDLARVSSLALPDPEWDAVGEAGRQALQSLGLWDALAPRLVLTEYLVDSLNFVASQRADVGLCFRNYPQPKQPGMLSYMDVEVAFSFPPESYSPQEGLAAVTRNCVNPERARRFLAFLASAQGQSILAQGGLTPVSPAVVPPGPQETRP